MGEKENRKGEKGLAQGFPTAWFKWGWLVAGLVLAGIGGGIKILSVMKDPQLFEYIFFSGVPYVMMISGLVLVIVAIGQHLIFGAETEPE